MARAPKKTKDDAAVEPVEQPELPPVRARFDPKLLGNHVVDPGATLTIELHRTQMVVAVLDELVGELGDSGVANPIYEYLHERWMAERKHMAALSTAMLKLSIEGALVAVEQQKVEILVRAVTRAIEEAGMDATVSAMLIGTIARELDSTPR